MWRGVTDKNTVVALVARLHRIVYAKSIMHEMITRDAIFLDRGTLLRSFNNDLRLRVTGQSHLRQARIRARRKNSRINNIVSNARRKEFLN